MINKKLKGKPNKSAINGGKLADSIVMGVKVMFNRVNTKGQITPYVSSIENPKTPVSADTPCPDVFCILFVKFPFRLNPTPSVIF